MVKTSPPKKTVRRTRLKADPWHDTPETVRRFLAQQTDYEQLCTEVAYILKKRINVRRIEISDITYRSKTLKSFLEKITRKKYVDAFSEVSDFAGVRVVCLYVDDIQKIEDIIRAEFDVFEKVDKMTDQGVDRFGYGAIHFVVRLGTGSSGARYDDLKSLACEIQLRTVSQDAWAIIEHHLFYKQESDIPKQLLRKLNRLSAIFEDADEQFERVRKERTEYLDTVRSQSKQPDQFLDNDLNLDSFNEYLSWKFRGMEIEARQGQVNRTFEMLDKLKYAKLFDLDSVVDKTAAIRETFLENLMPTWPKSRAAANQVGLSLFIADENVRDYPSIPVAWHELLEKLVGE